MKSLFRLGIVLLIGIMPAFALAQSYPTRPVRFIIPFAPGGGADLVGRVIGQKLTEIWGQPVIVDNRPGAGANIAAGIAARAAPDGYTVFQFNEEFAQFIKSEISKFRGVAATSGLSP